MMQTSELTGATLDWAVAKCENFYTDGFSIIRVWNNRVTKIIPGDYETGEMYTSYSPSSDWSQGGPIIEREGVDICTSTRGGWIATLLVDCEGSEVVRGEGATALVAAMCCYVASKLGDIVEVPEELL